jgi:hypothetical protein
MPEHNELKLIPLRRLADKNGYSAAYLSLLVQRKRLEAKKVGRNYFTTLKWFNCYLRKYAYDDIRLAYQGILPKIENDLSCEEAVITGVRVKKTEVKIKTGGLGLNRFRHAFTTVILTVVFVLAVFSSVYFYFTSQDKGQVAGVDEASMSSTTIDNMTGQ